MPMAPAGTSSKQRLSIAKLYVIGYTLQISSNDGTGSFRSAHGACAADRPTSNFLYGKQRSTRHIETHTAKRTLGLHAFLNAIHGIALLINFLYTAPENLRIIGRKPTGLAMDNVHHAVDQWRSSDCCQTFEPRVVFKAA